VSGRERAGKMPNGMKLSGEPEAAIDDRPRWGRICPATKAAPSVAGIANLMPLGKMPALA